MKTKLSVALNILLVAALGIVALSNRIREERYRQITKILMLTAASKIDSGKPESVSRILKDVSRVPRKEDLFSMVEKLSAINSADQVGAPDGDGAAN